MTGLQNVRVYLNMMHHDQRANDSINAKLPTLADGFYSIAAMVTNRINVVADKSLDQLDEKVY